MSDVATTKTTSAVQVPAAEVPGVQGLMTLAVGVVVVVSLYLAREVLVPITLAVLLSFVLAPLVDLLRRARLGRIPSVFLAVLLAVGVILALGGLIVTQVAQLASDFPRYAEAVEHKIDTARNATLGRMSEMVGRLGKQMDHAAAPPPPAALPAQGRAQAKPPAEAERAPTPVEVRTPPPTPFEVAQRLLSPLLGPLSTMGIVFIVAIFILMQQEDLRDRLIRLFGSGDLHRTTAAMDDAGRRLSKYFLTQLALNTAFGLIIGIGLFFIGVPSPVLWGICAALFRFVPYIGSVIAAIFPIALAAGVEPGWSMVIAAGALFLITEPLMGQVVEPLVYGHSSGLSPISVVVAAIFWAWLWGPIGLILSMPLTLCLVVMGRHIKRLEFIDVLLGDRPALTPIESFYQRMLAGDPDEAQDYAEILLKERSLSSYYDEVALKGLQLAANDAERGVLLPEQIERIGHAIDELIVELADHEDADPPPRKREESAAGETQAERELPRLPPPEGIAPGELPAEWRSNPAVLCIAGRGPLDLAPAAMLAQLLRKHGLGARVVPHTEVARGSIGALDVAGVAMVCVTYLDIGGSPSHLRYLLRRLRHRVPGATMLVGLWPIETPENEMQRIHAAIGADHYPTSLRDAVEICCRTALAFHGAVTKPVPAAAPSLVFPEVSGVALPVPAAS